MIVLLQSLFAGQSSVERSKSFAGVGVADRRHEEGKAEGQHENIQHGMLLCGVVREGQAGSPFLSGLEVPPGA
jgi:hypothetical protein